MSKRLIRFSGIAAAVCLLVTVASGSHSGASHGAFAASRHHHPPIIVRERHGTQVTSTNWSGYAVTAAAGSVTDAKGSWIVPMVQSCGSPDSYSSFWVGIDGYSSNTVEQTGTDSDCV